MKNKRPEKDPNDFKVGEIEGIPVLNTTGVRVYHQWYPTTKYSRRVLVAWDKALNDVYAMCRLPVPNDMQIGILYDDKHESWRVGNMFFISAWVVRNGSNGMQTFRRRFANYIRTVREPGLRERFHRQALVEICKTEKSGLDTW